MMDGTFRSGLDRALELSEQMLDAAGAGNWEALPTLQSECDTLLRRDYPADASTRDAFRIVQERHRSLLELVTRARDAIGRDLGKHRHNHSALNAYLDSSHLR